MENYILKSLNIVQDLIKNKQFLNVKNKKLLELFSKEREDNQKKHYIYSSYKKDYIVSSIEYKELILNCTNLKFGEFGYVEFTFPIQEFSKDYIKLEIEDLDNYSKLQLILLYEGWQIYDGIDISTLSYYKDMIYIKEKGLRDSITLRLPNKNCPLKRYNLNK